MEHFDVVIVGAGLSGIGAAHHLQGKCPTHSYVILEGRDAIGGTWDLFRYPGIRSDSDMFTLGYSFRPWTEAKTIADGPSILSYVRDTAEEAGIDQHIRFNHRVRSAAWSSAETAWTVTAESGDRRVSFTCNFLYMCSGYYDYAEGHNPEFEGREHFRGPVVHPQHWPEHLDYADKKVVVIGERVFKAGRVHRVFRSGTGGHCPLTRPIRASRGRQPVHRNGTGHHHYEKC